MKFTQYYLQCLSHASYLIGDETSGRAVVVDPQRDVDEYLAEAVKLDFDRDRFMLISRHLISVLTLGDNALARKAVFAIIKAIEHFEMAEGGEVT